MLLMYIGSWWPDAEPQVQEEDSRAGHRQSKKKDLAKTTTIPATTNLATLATNQGRLRRKRDSMSA